MSLLRLRNGELHERQKERIRLEEHEGGGEVRKEVEEEDCAEDMIVDVGYLQGKSAFNLIHSADLRGCRSSSSKLL
jgi:hypothetical protein